MAKRNITESNKEQFYQRMRQLADIHQPINEGLKNCDLIDYKRAGNGSAYAIIKENHHYYIKVSNKQDNTLNVADFTFIGGLENKLNYQYKSVSEADKNRNFYLKNINEGMASLKADNAKTRLINLNEGKAINEEFGEEEKPEDEVAVDDAGAEPESDSGDEKSDIDAAAEKIDDLDAAASAEKSEPAADASADLGGAEDAAADLGGADAGAPDMGGAPDASADMGADAGAADLGGAEDAAGDLGGADAGAEDMGADAGEEGGDAEKVELKKIVGKIQQLASSVELTPEDTVGQLKQILAGYKGAISGLDDVEKKEVANKIMKGEEGGEESGEGDIEGAEAGLGDDAGLGDEQPKLGEESMSGFKAHIQEMGYDPANTQAMSMMEMVGIMNSYFNKMDGNGEEADVQGLAEYMNDEIVSELAECGYGDYATQARGLGEGSAQYGSEEPMAMDSGSMGEDGEGEDELDAEGGEEELGADAGIEGGEDEAGLEDVTGEIPAEEPAGEEVPQFPTGARNPAEMPAGPQSIAPAHDVLGAGVPGGSGKKSLTVDLNANVVNLTVNETHEGKLRKVVKRRIEEKMGLKQPLLNESKDSALLKLIDKYIEDEIKKRS